MSAGLYNFMIRGSRNACLVANVNWVVLFTYFHQQCHCLAGDMSTPTAAFILQAKCITVRLCPTECGASNREMQASILALHLMHFGLHIKAM